MADHDPPREHALLALLGGSGLGDLLERSDEALVLATGAPFDQSRVVAVNGSFERLFGYDAEEIVGQPPLLLAGPETDAEALRRVEEVLHRGEDITVPLVLRTQDGRSLRVLARCFRVVTPTGDTLFAAWLRDPVATVAPSEESGSEAWAQALVAGITDVILLVDAEARITWASPSVTFRLGYTVDEVLGRPSFDFLHPDEAEQAVLDFSDTVVHGTRFTPTTYRVRHADGSHRVMNLSANPLFDHPAVQAMIITASDVTERAEAEERFRRSEAWAQTLIEAGRGLVVVTDTGGIVRYASAATREVLGMEPEDLVGRTHPEVVHPDDIVLVETAYRQAVGDAPPEPVEFRVCHTDGSFRVLSATFADLLDHPSINGMVLTAHDVTARRRTEQVLAEQTDLLEAIARGTPLEVALQRVAQMIEHSIDGTHAAVGIVDDDGVIRTRYAPTLAREAVATLDGIAPSTDLGRALRDPETGWVDIDPDPGSDPGWTGIDADVLAEAGVGRLRLLPLRAPGSGELLGMLSVADAGTASYPPGDQDLFARASNLASIAIERRRFESRLEYQARFDPLTGLPNRAMLHERIHEAIRRSGRLGSGVAVVFIDLDRFKVINDSVGHAQGDELLALVAARLRGPLRPGDTLARFGGDEFMVVCNRVRDEDEARRTAHRFAAELVEPFELGQGSVHVTASMGIAYTSDADELAEALIRNADVAMYRAKDSGRNQLVVFTESIDHDKVEQLATEQALRAAIQRDEFELHYQPVVDLRSGGMGHAEALVRWHRPGHGLVMPGDFIPLAEETGLIVPLGWWVLEEACRTALSWPELPGGGHVQIAVNLSARQLAAPDLLQTVQRILIKTSLGASQLCFEITESDLVRDLRTAVDAVEGLKSLGVRIAIDDFGTGYSSLDYIRHFAMADYLKIDRAFVDGVEREGSQEEAIVTAAIGMAKSLGFVVVAEGVETLFQMEALKALDCDLAQGFLFSRPVPADQAIELMAEPSPTGG